jgi:hypothetical protein
MWSSNFLITKNALLWSVSGISVSVSAAQKRLAQ